jgi:D-lactate dehydrogenase
MKLVLTEVMGNQEKFRAAFPNDDVDMFDGPLDEDELIHEAEGASAISVFIRTRVSERVIDGLPKLRLINTRSAGFDHIAAKYAMGKGITVTHVPDYGPHVVAEHAFCLLLACARKLVAADRSVKELKKFDFEPFRGSELRGKVLGVVGTGKIGAEVIRIAQGFGLKVVAFDLYMNERLAREFGFPYLSLEQLLEESDFVTIHLPLTPSTEHLIDRNALLRMKKGSILINTARGNIVDEIGLKELLDSGHLAAAGLDVIDDESHPENDPLLDSKNVTVSPHIAFYTEESIGRMIDESIQTIKAFKSGRPTNEIPKEYVEKIKMHTHPQD